MAANGTSGNGKTMLLFTGNIMANGNRGSFLNTSMSKSNAEVSLSRGRGLMTACEFTATY